ncbi:MAG: hypothetical protein A2010_14605 [Nitrospirae bacterium GWD2_57_9]|nr:MAG: hypothetical protein A2010_14605 [Nitrospirae bacterium GWD2_57_9]OGW49753.1 MAG: hypothetical protein A2078_12730 [Nitrospirae bacterium GWC2_57_9]
MEKTTLLWILSVLLVLIGLAGIVLPALPGTILVFLGLFLAAWIDHFERVGWITLTALGLLTVLSFVIDYLASVYGVKRAGAGRQAVIGSVAGLAFGMFLGIPGIILGPFIGAVIGELMANQDLIRAGRAGLGTWLGLVLGIAVKLAISLAMIGTFIVIYLAGS